MGNKQIKHSKNTNNKSKKKTTKNKKDKYAEWNMDCLNNFYFGKTESRTKIKKKLIFLIYFQMVIF